jgi:hypothetical protein
MREWYDADVFGQVNEVHMGYTGPHWNGQYFNRPSAVPIPKQPIPNHINWDSWLGPCKMSHYNEVYHPKGWRSFYEYGTGMFGDWFCHVGDGAVWALDLYAPTTVECTSRGPVYMDGMIPDHSVIKFDFPARGKKDPCSMYWYDGMSNGGKKVKVPEDWDLGKPKADGSYWYGSKCNGYLDKRSNNPRITNKSKFRDFRKNVKVEEKFPRLKKDIKGPFQEWIAAIKGEIDACGSNFDYAAPLTEVSLIGVIAQRFGGKIEWDSKNMKITNRPELNEYVREPVRKGWEYGQDLWT